MLQVVPKLSKFRLHLLYSRSTHSLSSPLKKICNFASRHIGPEDSEISTMCKTVGVNDLDDLVKKALPNNILLEKPTNLGPAVSETETLERLREISKLNKVFRSYIGMGYNNTITPPVFLRNIFESPSWYTQVR
jgi:glycine dehydrogenase